MREQPVTTEDRGHAADVSKFYRQTHNLSQGALGKRLGYAQGLISAVELGQLAAPKALVRAILALEDEAPKEPEPATVDPKDEAPDELDDLFQS